jgi:hypothetical protein
MNKNSRWSRLVAYLFFALAPQIVSAATLQEWFDLELARPHSSTSPDFQERLRGKHLVFVGGIMNELASVVGNYFIDNIEVVKSLGITYDYLGFSSAVSVPKNADLLYKSVGEIFNKMQKPLVLIGHSMGGAESLYMVLKHPELLILNQVDRVVLIQAPIGGSNLAEKFKSNWAAYGLEYYLKKGLHSLSTDRARANFSEAFKFFQSRLEALFGSSDQIQYQREYERISNRVFYVRSQYDAETSLSFGLQIVLAFLREKLDDAVSNDGLLYCEDQMLKTSPTFGSDLGILNGDHVEFVISGLASRSSSATRTAFTRAMLRSIYDSN